MALSALRLARIADRAWDLRVGTSLPNLETCSARFERTLRMDAMRAVHMAIDPAAVRADVACATGREVECAFHVPNVRGSR